MHKAKNFFFGGKECTQQASHMNETPLNNNVANVNEVSGVVVADEMQEHLIDAADAHPNLTAARHKPSRSKCALPIAALCIFVLGVAAIGFSQGRKYEHKAGGVTKESAHLALLMNTTADPCDAWQYLCGGYVATHYPNSNVLKSFQTHITASLVTLLLQDPTTDYHKFYDACMAYDGPEIAATHLETWQRGLPSNNVQFFQTVELDDGAEYAAMLVKSLDNLTQFNYAFEINATIISTNESLCTGSDIIELAKTVLNRNILYTLISNQPIDVLCRYAANKTQSADNTLPSSTTESCFAATAALWPSTMSHLYENYVLQQYGETLFDTTLALARSIQDAMAATLTVNGYNNLAAKIKAVTPYVRYKGLNENYNMPSGTFAQQLVHLQTEQFRLSVQHFADSMPGYWLNAYYRGADNDVHITTGMLHFVAEYAGSNTALFYGKMGFVLAHEFAHSLDSTGITYDQDGNYQIGTILQSKTNANKYAGDTECLRQEFETNGRTTNEDVADFIAMSVLKSLTQTLSDSSTLTVCAPTCVELSTMQLFYAGFAHTWCSGYRSVADTTDEHSPGKERVVHALTTANAATMFGCSADKETKNTCSILGFL